MIKKYWKIVLLAAVAFVSAAFYLLSPESGEIVDRSMQLKETETDVFEVIGDKAEDTGLNEEPDVDDTGFTELQRAQIEEIVRNCISSEIERSVTDSVRDVITKLRDDGTLTQALYTYADIQSGLININKADSSELKSLPGIGDAKASAIIRYREENGGFQSIDELLNVSGISEKILESIRNDITV